MSTYEIAVIGAGISGLASASFLAADGHNVTLFEKFSTPQPTGAGLLLQPTGLASLARLGLDQHIIERGSVIHHLYGKTDTETTVFDIGYGLLGPNTFGLGIHRGTLFNALYETATSKPIHFKTGKTVVDAPLVTPHATPKRTVITDQGDQFGPFDLVIDSSGIHSQLRDKYGATKVNKPYPYGAVWGVFDDPNKDIDLHTLQQRYIKANVMVGCLPIGYAPQASHRSVAMFWSLPVRTYHHWRNAGMHAWKENVTALWPELSPHLATFQSPDDLTFAQYGDVVMRHWHEDALLFIGDSAHCMSPQLGQGANLGLVDAMRVADILHSTNRTGHPLSAALAQYSHHRRAHLRFYQTASRWLTPFFQSDHKISPWLRDKTFNLMCHTPYIKKEMVRTLSGMKTGVFSHLNPGDFHARYTLK